MFTCILNFAVYEILFCLCAVPLFSMFRKIWIFLWMESEENSGTREQLSNCNFWGGLWNYRLK